MADSWMDRIRRGLAPPDFADEDRSRTARLLNTISLALLVVSILAMFPSLLSDSRTGLFIGLAMVGLQSLVQYILRRGYVRAASLVQSGALWLITTYLAATGGGVRSTSFVGYILVVLVATLISGSYAGAVVVALSVAAGLTMLYLESLEVISFVPADTVSAMTTYTALLVLAAVVIHMAIRGIYDALGRARQSNQELQAAQEVLERRMAEEQEQAELMRRLAQREQEQRERLQIVFARVREAAGRLSAAVAEILAVTSQQSAGASEQSAAIAQASTTIDEVRAIVDQSAQQAQGVADLARRTAEVSQSGQQAVAETIGGMDEIKEKTETIAQNILALSEQAQAIGQIITTVSEIAVQSNMLALNAAVEAARAGEAGRGFSVVAGEVRGLAEQSRAATVQIKELLTEIQRGVNTAVMSTEEGMKRADAGSRLAGEAGLSIRQLGESVIESAQAAAQIVAAAGQQVAGMEQVALAMHNIHQVVTQTAASARQSEQAARELNELAGQLRQLVAEHQED